MSKYRSAQGKMIDMTALASQNEKARAVGNMKVNARGDTIDSEGKIVIPVTEKVAEKYSRTVGQRTAQARPKPQPDPIHTKAVDLTEEERDLLGDDDHDKEVEAIKAKETKK